MPSFRFISFSQAHQKRRKKKKKRIPIIPGMTPRTTFVPLVGSASLFPSLVYTVGPLDLVLTRSRCSGCCDRTKKRREKEKEKKMKLPSQVLVRLGGCDFRYFIRPRLMSLQLSTLKGPDLFCCQDPHG